MKKRITPYILLTIVILTAALMLAACGSGSSSPASTNEAGNASSATEAATSAPASGASCLVGSWKLTDFSSYMNSIEQNTANASGGDVTLTSQTNTGDATWTFNADNTAKFTTSNFEQDFTMTTTVSDQKIDIPISLKINGSSTSDYSVDGDQITFSNQDQGDLTINVDVMGTSSPADSSLMGNSGTTQLYQFACPDANTLTLKVIAVKNVDLAPLTLTRVQ